MQAQVHDRLYSAWTGTGRNLSPKLVGKESSREKDADNIAAAKLDEQEPETDDELIELVWQDLTSGSRSHKAKDYSDEELIEDDAIFEQDPQLPGSPSRTQDIAARLKREAKCQDANAHNEAEQAKRIKTVRELRIQNIATRGMQSGTFDRKVRWEANQPAIKVQRGIAGERIRRVRCKHSNVSYLRAMSRRR